MYVPPSRPAEERARFGWGDGAQWGVESELGDEMFGCGCLEMRSLRGGLFRFWGVRVYIDGVFLGCVERF